MAHPQPAAVHVAQPSLEPEAHDEIHPHDEIEIDEEHLRRRLEPEAQQTPDCCCCFYREDCTCNQCIDNCCCHPSCITRVSCDCEQCCDWLCYARALIQIPTCLLALPAVCCDNWCYTECGEERCCQQCHCNKPRASCGKYDFLATCVYQCFRRQNTEDDEIHVVVA
eukprot:m.293377 g.293377  ORF g.293377 m.293377 type:complete len:167 (+) comp21141_c0_seq1:58-558(+)